MLSKDALAVLMDHIQAIISAMRAKQNFMYLVDGAEVNHIQTFHVQFSLWQQQQNINIIIIIHSSGIISRFLL